MSINKPLAQDPSKFLHKSIIVVIISFFIAWYLFFFIDKVVGGALCIGLVLGIIASLFYYLKPKEEKTDSAKNIIVMFLLGGGTIMLILSVGLVIFNYYGKELILTTIPGVVSVVFGVILLRNRKSALTNKIKWREMQLGMKVIVVFLVMIFFLSLWSTNLNLKKPSFFLGFIIQYPISIIFKIVYLLIPIFIVIGIFGRIGWKIILSLQGFNIVNGLIEAVYIVLTPLTELLSKWGHSLPEVSNEALRIVSFQAKLKLIFLMFPGLLIALIIWLYIYVNREYFLNK